MNALNPEADANKVFQSFANDGVAIVPLDVAYAVFGGTGEAIRKIFTAKGRSFTKPNGMLANFELFCELHSPSEREKAIVRAVIDDYGLPMSVVAPYRQDHPIFARLDPFAMERSTKAGTLDLLMNAGPLHRALARQSLERLQPVLGSSANRSLAGSKFRLEDVETEIRQIASIEIDYGLCRYHNPVGISSTIIDLKTFGVHRHGVCFEQIADIFRRHFRIELPPKPAVN